jgi:hypothetical protein
MSTLSRYLSFPNIRTYSNPWHFLLQAHCHHGLGMLYAGTGQAEQGRAELADAIYHDMGMIFCLPQAKAALAQVQ